MTRTTLTLRITLLVLILAGAIHMTPLHAQAATDEPLLDLTALVLTPDDVEDVGIAGYGSDYGRYRTRPQIAEEYARDEGEDLDDALDIYDEMGLLRSYSVRLALPIEDGSFIDDTTEGLWINILEFESPTDARSTLTVSGENDREDGHEFIDNAPAVGDESFVSRVDAKDPESGDPTIELHLNYVVDTFAVSIELYDVVRDDEGSRATEPDLDTLIELGELQLDRITSAGDDLPSLGVHVLRLGDEDGSVYTVGDRYSSIDGTPLRRYADTDEFLETRSERMDEEGMIASYGVEQDIRSGTDENPGEPHFTVRLYDFEDDDAAESWVEDIAFDRLAAEVYIDEIESIDLAIAEADTTVAASYTATYGDAEIIGTVVWVQVGDQVARITLDAMDVVDLDVIEELMETQIDCLGEPTCDAVQVPAEITDLL